jgi:parvulin-like peptidyl-prolyl isomerase
VDGAQAELVGRYGEGFASAVEKAPVGEVSGPYRSKFGFHLVKVVGRGEGRESRYEEVASHVSFAMLVDRRERAVDEFVRRSFARTRVEVNGSKVATLARVRRLALRDEGSAEDGL